MFIEIAHAATEAAGHEAETGLLGTFGLDWKLFLAQLINVGVIVFVLTKWVYRPLMKTMDERRIKIEQGVKNAERAEKKLGSAKEAEEKIVNEARALGKEFIDEGKKKGGMECQRRVEASKVIIDGQLKESKDRLERETTSAQERAKKDIGKLVLAATEKVLNTALDEKQHRKLIEDSIRELEKTHG
jgi:F-type H+-transporting ATPase subunit b